MNDKQILEISQNLLTGYEWEIYLSHKEKLISKSKNLQIETVIKANETGLAIRLKKDGKTGFSYITNPDKEKIGKAINEAKELLEISTTDVEINFPSAHSAKQIQELYDSFSINQIPEKEKIEIATEIERKIREKDSRIKNVRDCMFSQQVFYYSIINSSGLNVSEKGSIFTAAGSAVAEDKNSSQIAWGFTQSRYLKDLKIDEMVDEIVFNALSLLGAKPVNTKILPVLFPPSSFVQLLEAFFPVFSGDYFIKGKTYLKDKKGEKIASENFTLIDNGKLKYGVATRNFDDEGNPTKETVIVKNGVFEGFLHSIYTGTVSGEGSTGNGYRRSFKEQPSVKPSNFYLKETDTEIKNILKNTGEVVQIVDMMGLHTANPVTGDFSVGISGFILKNGEIIEPISGMTLSGNFFELLSKIVAIGKDLKFYGGTGSPSVIVSDLIVGGF